MPQERLFSDLIFEAEVFNVSHREGTCSLRPLTVNLASVITDVPIPVVGGGGGNAGIFIPLAEGTNVIAAHTAGAGRITTAIISTVMKVEQLEENFNNKGIDTPVGRVSYPELVNGRMAIRGEAGSQVACMENGDVLINTIGGGGLYLRRNKKRSSYTLATNEQVSFSEGGKSVFGPIRRIKSLGRTHNPKEDLAQVPVHSDTKYALVTDRIGFFTGYPARQKTIGDSLRNPAISEYRMVINEISTDSQFTGFDDEVVRVVGGIGTYDERDKYERNRELGNTLHLAEHELIEVIGGNVVDLLGNVLDLNYRKLSYGGPNNTVPTEDVFVAYDRARRISRRGIGYHFQLTTNSKKTDKSESQLNFIFDVDKEGMIKINIPASSDSGNIPYPLNATFASDSSDKVTTEYLNPSVKEPVPVTLRNGFGEVIVPNKESQGKTHRSTGIRYSNSDKNPYFPSTGDAGSATDPIRINSTRYHNMYATAERLIANRIERINVCHQSAPADDGSDIGVAIPNPFVVLMEDVPSEEEGGAGDDPVYPKFMSTVSIVPAKPALKTGGDTLVAGVFYDGDNNPPLSNSFESTQGADGNIGINIVDENQEARGKVGGKSAHVMLGGSIEASIGADNIDKKSILLDTDGGAVVWLGTDNKTPGRSLVMQTDGEMFINVGGSYRNDDPDNPSFNPGRFEMRVNVVDKGFVGAEFVDTESGESPDEGGNPFKESDFIISISERGIVIAGNKSGAPMIIRNEDQLVLESAADVLIKSGTDVKFVGADGKVKNLASMGK